MQFDFVLDTAIHLAVDRAVGETSFDLRAAIEAAQRGDSALAIDEAIGIAGKLNVAFEGLSDATRLRIADVALRRLLDRAAQANDAAATRH